MYRKRKMEWDEEEYVWMEWDEEEYVWGVQRGGWIIMVKEGWNGMKRIVYGVWNDG